MMPLKSVIFVMIGCKQFFVYNFCLHSLFTLFAYIICLHYLFTLFFTAHIYFDDAFEISDICDDWMQVNQFVRTFVQCVDEAGSYVHQTNIRLRPPKKVPTPYGGRLVYTLPGKTKMFVHMKVMKSLFRNKRFALNEMF